MKFVFVFAVFFLCLRGLAQGNARNTMAAVTGSVFVPTLQSINIDLLQEETIHFSKAEEYDNGQLRPAFLRATVISNLPYLVSVMASGDAFTSATTGAPSMPVSIIRLRSNINNEFISLSGAAQPLLVSKSDQMKSVYTVDAAFNPGWNYSGGQYNTSLIFTLTAQ